MTATSDIATPLRVTLRGHIHDEDQAYVLEKIRSVFPFAPAPVLGGHLVLGWKRDPAQPHRARLEVGLDVNGILLRAHVAADGMREGADLLQDRLRRQLTRLQDRARPHHRGHAAARTADPEIRERLHQPAVQHREPTEPPEIVRRKTFALVPLTADEAVAEMELLDHDFYLYTDAETQVDSVVRHDEKGGRVVHSSAPRLTESQAVERLEIAGEPLVFFQDVDDERGRVLYRRFDGRYGLIVPA
jgi:ribosome-associated translation inhibitor RaiA